jgi:hypothetical protein
MINLRIGGALALAAGLATVAGASPIYIEDDNGNLGTITTGGAYSNIGMTMLPTGGVVVLGDIAENTGGALYGTSFNGAATELYSINTSNGALTPIGLTGSGASAAAGLTFSGNGTLYGDDGSNLVTINTSTGAETVVGNMGVLTDGDFAFNSMNTAMYMTGNGGNLYSIDPSNGMATLIGSTGVGDILFGLVNTTSGLYGFGFDNNVYSLNTSTGAATLVAPFSGLPNGWGGTYGADTAPASVPALPAAIPMLLGLGRAVIRRRRKV